MARVITLCVNGQHRTLETDPELPLLWALRDHLGLKGTKYGCGVGRCGICTVLIDGAPHHACMVSLAAAVDKDILTVEGLASRDHPLVRAWVAEQVPQCGYCQGGQLIAAAALLAQHPKPTDAEIDSAMAGVLCRCGTYPRIRRAIHRVADGAALPALPATLPPPPDTGIALDDWLRVHADDTVTLRINHSEMGQGALTSLAALVAEELELPLAQIRTEFAPADPKYKNPLWGEQFTGGSSSIRGEWEPLRRRAAEARARLLGAAAQAWKLPPGECRARDGAVVHEPSGRHLAYAALAPAAAREPAPKRLALKTPGECRLLGHAIPRLDLPDMAAGRTVYGIDVVLPGMKVATIVRSPTIGGKLVRFDDRAARDVPGVLAVLAIESGVAVVADDFWSALRGRERLAVEWRAGRHADLTHEAVYAELCAALAQKGKVARDVGHAPRDPRSGERVIEARYLTPYLAHAPLEPMNCVADVRPEGCDVYVGTQSQVDTQKVAAELTGLPRKRVRVHTQFLGGGFGRRLDTDFVAEAVELSQRLGLPVQVIWTRADDLQHDKYRPAGAAWLAATLDADGLPQALLVRIAGSDLVLDGIDVPYAIPQVREEHVELASPVPAGAWRSVGASNNAFAIESFVDELAHAAGRDPLAYRLAALAHAPRHRAVLELAARQANWGTPLPAGHGRGIAVYGSFGSVAAMVVEVVVEAAVAGDAIRAARVVAAIDCGFAVNPDAVRAQIEGSIAMGLSAALKEELRLRAGQVEQAHFADYPILTIAEMPAVEVHIAPSTEPPGGVGEPGVPVVAPALANAVFAATGKRLRRLPLQGWQ
jgi:isoquinoline 1-oxidoreductase beta subunit